MAKIPGWVYLVVGGIMAIFSNFIYSKTDKGALLLFFYLGLVFVAIGVFKLVTGYIFKGKKEKPSRIVEKGNSVLANMVNKDLANVNIQQQPQQKHIVYCQRCGTKHYNTSNFCHKCGTPLR